MTTPSSETQLLAPGDHPDVVIDLSNVCRDERLGGSQTSWERYLLVLDAWKRKHGRLPRGVAIADSSLRPRLSNADARAFDCDIQRGVLRVARGDADVEILAYARDTGARVLSRDGFKGHRGVHPWIQGDTGRFIGWRRKGDRVVLFTRTMRWRSPFTVSEGEESDRMKGARVDPSLERDRAVLLHAFRCENASCGLARRYSNHLEEPPSMRKGIPSCPECGKPVADLGPRADLVELVVEVGHTELRRISLVRGEDLILGRRELEGAARRLKVADGIERVSREHIKLAVTPAGETLVTDLGSRNGSALATWSQSAEAWGDATRIESGVATPLGRRDAVLLAAIVRIRRSGQRFPLAAPGKPVVIGDRDLMVTRPPEEDEE